MEPGARLGRYELVAPLGRGGAGEVWEAVLHGPQGFRKPVAVKVLRRGPDDALRRQALIHEARLGALLSHPNVVATLELGSDGPVWYVAMELVRGASLRELASELGPLPAPALLDVALQASAALAHVHGLEVGARRAGLVHRDVKPSNLLVDRSGVVKLADLGIARALGTDTEPAGTPGFAAPEQVEGREDARADLFSLGATLYALAVGKRPFGTTIGSVFTCEERLADPGFLAPLDRVLPGLGPIVARCLRLDPEDRFPDADTLAVELRALRTDALRGPSTGELLARIRPALRVGRGWSGDGPTPVAEGVLPVPRDPYVGRDDDRRRLAELLRRPGTALVTVLGPGGMGKTRLALEVARATAPSWPGGAWFVDLAEARTPDAVVAAVARALAVPLDGADGRERVGYALRARGRALVVLDNLEQVAEPAAAIVAEWLAAAPEVVLLATSRVLLRVRQEVPFEVGPLPSDEAAELFARRAARPVAEGDRPLVERIATALEGIPLALELAAARTRVLPLAKVLERLDDRLRLLAGGGPDRPQRHRSLRASLEASWELLDPIEQAALAQLSVFAGGATLQAAEHVLDLSAFPDPPWAIDVLEKLADHSLVRYVPEQDRFQMLVTVQVFAAEQLDQATRAAAEARHGAWFAGLLGPLAVLAGRDLRADADDLELALRRAVERGDARVAVGALRGVGGLAEYRGPFLPTVAWADRVLALPGLRPRDVFEVQVVRGRMLYAVRHMDEAEEAYRAAHELADDDETRFLAHSGLASVHRMRSDVVRAQAHYETALQHARRCGSPRHLGAALANFAKLRYALGFREEALRTGEEALAIASRLGDPRLTANALVTLAAAVRDQDPARSAEMLQEAAEQAAALGDTRMEVQYRTNVALLLRELGRTEESRALYERSLRRARELGDRGQEADAHQGLGVLLAESEPAASLAHLEAALRIVRETGDRQNEVFVLAALGISLFQAGRLGDAITTLEDAVGIGRAVRMRRAVASTLTNLGQARCSAGDLAGARAALDEALRICREIGSRRSEGIALVNLAGLALAEGRREVAREQYEAGLAVHREVGNRRSEGIALANLATLALEDGRPEDALVLLAEARALHREVGNQQSDAAAATLTARAWSALGRHDEALRLLAEGLGIARSVGNAPAVLTTTCDEVEVRWRAGDRERALRALAEVEQGAGPEPPRELLERLEQVRALVSAGGGLT